MPDLSSLEDIERLYAAHGEQSYGEAVTQIQHALQCAALARADDAPDSLVAAALLHDLGHLFEAEAAGAELSSDDRHEIVGAQALKGLFGAAVRAPIALHVAAKRYLCFKASAYLDALSPASQASLRLQGGPFDAAQAAAFERRPHWRAAVALRRFDDLGKSATASEDCFGDYLPLLRGLIEPPGARPGARAPIGAASHR